MFQDYRENAAAAMCHAVHIPTETVLSSYLKLPEYPRNSRVHGLKFVKNKGVKTFDVSNSLSHGIAFVECWYRT